MLNQDDEEEAACYEEKGGVLYENTTTIGVRDCSTINTSNVNKQLKQQQQ
jgi:hypothetical protein